MYSNTSINLKYYLMKKLLQTIIFFLINFYATNLYAQNIMINVNTKNAGIVKKGELIFFEVTINNTSPIKSLPIYKIRPQITFPDALVSIPDSGHVLPKGWAITLNKNGVVMLSNGTDIIAENGSRTILIALKGFAVGGPSTIIGNLFFSNGISPGTQNGPQTKEDNIADNFSSSSIRVF